MAARTVAVENVESVDGHAEVDQEMWRLGFISKSFGMPWNLRQYPDFFDFHAAYPCPSGDPTTVKVRCWLQDMALARQ